MQITQKTLYSLVTDPFSLTCIGVNNFIPIGALDSLYIKDGQACYYKPILNDNNHIVTKKNTIKNILYALSCYLRPAKIEINNRTYFFMKGSMFNSEGKPLLILAMRKEVYFSPGEYKYFSDEPNTKKFSYNNYVLFYAAEFLTNPSLAPLHRRFQKEILVSCFTKGIGVRMMPSSEIENNTFARVYEIKKTKTIGELDQFLKTGLANYLYEEGDISMQIPVVEEGLSVEEEALLFDAQEEDFHASISPSPITINSVPTHIGAEALEGWVEALNATPIQWVDSNPSPGIVAGIDPAYYNGEEHAEISRRTVGSRPLPSIILEDDTE